MAFAFDILICMKLLKLSRDTFIHWKNCNAQRMGASLSYYAIFSIIPSLVFIIMLVGSFFSRGVVETAVIGHINNYFGKELGSYIHSILINSMNFTPGLLSNVISIALIIFGSVGVFVELDAALNEIMQSPKKERVKRSLWEKIRRMVSVRAISFSIIPIAGLVLLVSVSLSFLIDFVSPSVSLPYLGSLSHAVITLISFALSIVLFAIIYRMLPRVTLPWKNLFLGSIITAVLFLIGRYFILLYLHRIANTALFGSAGILVAILIWVYYSAQVFLIGASFIHVYSKRLTH